MNSKFSNRYTDEELINILKEFHIKNNKIPMSNDFKNKTPSVSTYYNRFGSWIKALEKAGFKKEKNSRKDYTDKELIDYLIKYYNEFNKIPTTRDLKNNKNYPTSETYRNHFGSHKNALIKSGLYALRKDKHQFDKISYSDEDILYMLNDFVLNYINKHNKIPTYKDIKNNKNIPSIITYIRRFGGIINIYKILGFKISEKSIKNKNTKNKSNEQLLNDFKKVVDEYGQIPCRNFRIYNLPNINTYLKRFN